MIKKIPLIIDTDPGVDDIMAISFALHNECYDVKLITTVAGNVEIDIATNNTLNLLNFLEKNIMVAKGAKNPMIEKLVDASNVHGTDLLIDYKSKSDSLLSKNHAVEEIKKELLKSSEKVTIMAIGPLTNIALLINMYPEIMNKIEHIYIMGGSLTRGNKTPMSEFNIATDPEAAKIVFNSGLKITLAPLDMGRKALVKKEHLDKIKTLNKTGKMFYDLLINYRGGSLKKGFRMYDACAWASMTKPEIFEYKNVFADVEISDTLARGMTIIDLENYLNRKPNINVCTEINVDMFNKWFIKSLKKCI